MLKTKKRKAASRKKPARPWLLHASANSYSLFPDVPIKPKKTKWVARGEATNKLVFSAYQGTNSTVFPRVLELYVPEGSRVADVTYGKCVFWKDVPKSAYELLATDIQTGTDCRKLPYTEAEIDCVVFDPPICTPLAGRLTKTIRTSRITIGTTVLRILPRSTTRRSSIYTSRVPGRPIVCSSPAAY